MIKPVRLKMMKGTDNTVSFMLQDHTGTALDLYGYSARLQVKRDPLDEEVVDDLSVENQRLIIDDASGNVLAKFPRGNTKDYPVATLVWDLLLVSEASVRCVAKGTIQVIVGVTDVTGN